VIILVLLVYTIIPALVQPTHFPIVKADWVGFQDKCQPRHAVTRTDIHSVVRWAAVQGVKATLTSVIPNYIINYIQTEWAHNLHLQSNIELNILNRNIQCSINTDSIYWSCSFFHCVAAFSSNKCLILQKTTGISVLTDKIIAVIQNQWNQLEHCLMC